MAGLLEVAMVMQPDVVKEGKAEANPATCTFLPDQMILI